MINHIANNGISQAPKPGQSSSGEFTKDGRSCIEPCKEGNPYTQLDNNLFNSKNEKGLKNFIDKIRKDAKSKKVDLSEFLLKKEEQAFNEKIKELTNVEEVVSPNDIKACKYTLNEIIKNNSKLQINSQFVFKCPEKCMN